MKGIEKASDKVIVAKLLELRPETEAKVTREFEALRSFRHERIAALLAAYKPPGKRKCSTACVLVLNSYNSYLCILQWFQNSCYL